jgi:N12 class adenine-specific DNA methylase
MGLLVAENKPFLQSIFEIKADDPDAYALPPLPGQAPKKQEMPDATKAETPEAPADTRSPVKTDRYLPPETLRPVFDAAAKAFDVPVNVLMALGHQESRYNASAIGTQTQWGRAKGMMQYLDDTAKGLGINAFDPNEAIPAAAKQIRERLDKGYSMEDAVKEHFAGPDRKKWGEKTSAYGREVMEKVGRIGELIGTSVTGPEANQSALQKQLDTEEKGRYRVLTATEAEEIESNTNPTDKALAGGARAANNGPAARGITEEYITDPLKRGWLGMKRGFTANSAMFNARQLESIGKIDRGEKVQDADDVIGYQHMSPQQRADIKKQTGEAFLGAAKRTAELGQEVQSIPQDPDVAAISNAKSFDEWWTHFKKAPFKFIANTAVESLPNMAPGLVIGGAAGVASQLALKGGALTAGAAGMGVGSYAVDFPSTVMSALADLKIDTNNPDALAKAFSDPKIMEDVRKQAHAHASVVGALDAASGGVAGKTIVAGKGVAKKALNMGAQTVTQGVLGASGEAGGQIAQGKDDLEWGSIMGEFAGEMGGAPIEVAGAGYAKAKEAAARPRSIPAGPVTPTATPTTVAPAAPPVGPLSGALDKAAEQHAGEQRVTVSAPGGQVTGTVQAYQEDGQGGFVANIMGDDGQVHQFTSADGVQITPQAPEAGPLTQAMEKVAEEIAPETPTSGPAIWRNAENDLPVNVIGIEPQPGSDGRTYARVERDGNESFVPADEIVPVPQSPAKPAKAKKAGAPKVEAPAEPAESKPSTNLEAMDEPALRQRLKYIVDQAKSSGGWNKMFTNARREVEREINKRVAEQQAAPKAPEPVRTGPFSDIAEANSAMVQAAEATGQVHEVVEQDGKFVIQPVKEQPNGRVDSSDHGAGDVAATGVEAVAPAGAGQSGGRAGDQNTDADRAGGAGKTGPGLAADVPLASQAANAQPALGKDLAGAKPRYSYGSKQFDLTFANDIDRAAYISAQKTPSKRDADYVKFVSDATGMTEAQVREHGTKVRDAIKGQAKDAEPGSLAVAAVHSAPEAAPSRDAHAGKWFGSKEKADAYVGKKGAAETHEVVQTGKVRFEVKPKAAAALDAGAHEAATSPTNSLDEPTDAQKEAGNYKLGRVSVHGMDIAVENPRGSTRSGKRPDGSTWENTMDGHYGYINRTEGADGDHVDAYVGPRPDSDRVYVVDQIDQQTGGFDEHKIMLGYDSQDEATASYSKNFDKGWKVGPVKEMSVDEFKAWLKDGDTTKPVADAVTDRPRQDTQNNQPEATPVAPTKGDAAASNEQSAPKETMAERVARMDAESAAKVKIDFEKADKQKGNVVIRDGKVYRLKLRSKHENGKSDVPQGMIHAEFPNSHLILALEDGIRADAPAAQTRIDRAKAAGFAVEGEQTAPSKSTPANDDRFASNKVFTSDKVEAARARLKSKLSQLNSGIDPEMMMDGLTISGAYIESGVRTFSAYAKAMTDDFGDKIKPYLLSFYEGARHFPGVDNDGMSTPEVAKKQHEALTAETEVAKPAEPATMKEEVSNEPEQLDQPGARPLEGIPADEVQGTAAPGQAGRSSEGSGGANPRGNERTGSKRDGDPRGVGDGARDVPVPAAGDAGSRDGKPVQRAVQGSNGDPVGTDRVKPAAGTKAQDRASDYTILDPAEIGKGGPKAKYKGNVSAIRLLKELTEAGRQATRDEQAILAKYVGWGGIPQAFWRSDATASKGWDNEVRELASMLTQDEYRAAQASTRNAHYTSPEIVAAMWHAMRRLGFDGGRVLEPSVGAGNFFGLMPADMRKGAALHGVELDHITGGIAKQLYPQAKIAAPMGFQDYTIPNAYFDAAIGNPPFGSEKLYDGKRKDLSGFSIHNYFFAKSVDGLKPNGVLAMVVTNRMMDVAGDKARQYIANRAELLGAIRLPNNAFMANAGTEVTTDIIFLRKLAEGEKPAGESWMKAVDYTDKSGKTVPLNEYFARNPDMMLGEFGAYGSMYSPDDPALVARAGQDTPALLQAAINKLPENVAAAVRSAPVTETIVQATSAETVKVGSMFLQGDAIMVREPDSLGESQAKAVDLSDKAKERVTGMIRVRDALTKVRGLQLNKVASDKSIESARKELNALYDAFAKEHGPINLDTNKRLFRDDPTWPQISALEEGFDKGLSPAVAKKTGEQARKPSAAKAAIFSKRTQSPYAPPESASSAKDALVSSLSEVGRVDLPMMARLYGKPEEQIIKELDDLVFQDPGKGWVTRDEYLSGNVKAKLAQAKAQTGAGFGRNVEALQAVQPADIDAVDISVKAGAHWLPEAVMTEFANHVSEGSKARLVYNPASAGWSVVNLDGTPAARQRFETGRVSLSKVIEAAANQKTLSVYDTHDDGSRTLNETETQLANDKVNLIKEAWNRWVWQDDARREQLGRLYNDTFNTDVPRDYDGAHLTFPGKVGDDIIRLRPHQANAVWRIIQSGTTLTDHVVGAGKTFTLVAAAMELRRMGLAQKPLFVVPNHLVGEWAADFSKLYPGANVLVASKKDFEKENRKRLFARMATGDWDAVIVAHSSFGKVEVDPKEQAEFINEQIIDLTTSMDKMREAEGKGSRNVKQVQDRITKLREKLKKLFDAENKDDSLYFGELGIDAVFVDEAHEFKNLAFSSGMNRVAGLGNQAGSQKAADMFMKIQQTLKATGGRNVVFATGTPISNTMAEMYTMQRYLDYGTLKAQGIAHFDAWARMFGEVVTDWELSPSGQYKMNSRFSKFVNMPELMQRYTSFSDVVNRDDINRMLASQGKKLPVPKVKGGKPQNTVVERSPQQARYIGIPIKDAEGNDTDQYPEGSLVWRSENLPKKAEKGADNMLKVMGDARKAALDMRLIDPSAPDYPGSKVNVAAGRIKDIYERTAPDAGTQLVFIDLSTPKAAKGREAQRIRDLLAAADQGDESAIDALDKMSPDELSALESDFSVYDDLKAKLIAQGIPEKEIAFIHDANTELQKGELFGKVRSGRVRVMLGSTAKMGAGMNVQDRLVALHHLDAPWRPSDLEQREGRIIRQGNKLYDRDPENFEIEILRYATKQTLDSRMWQTIEGKANFIEQVRKGTSNAREIEDVAGEAANSAEMKAASSGNPLILEEMTLRQQTKKLETERSGHDREQFRLRDTVKSLERSIEYNERNIAELLQDAKVAQPEEFEITVGGKTFDKRADAGEAILAQADGMEGKESKKIGTYGGFEVQMHRLAVDQFSLSLTATGEYETASFTLSADPQGLAQRAANAVKGLEGDAKRLEQKVAQARKDIPQLQKQVAEWGKASDLTAAKQRHAAVLDQLKPKKKEQPKVEDKPEEPKYSVSADGATEAEFGPVHTEYKDDPKGAIERLMRDKTGEAIVTHPQMGDISLVYGDGKVGLSHIAARRGSDFMSRLPDLVKNGSVYTKATQPNRSFLGNGQDEATIRFDWDGQAKTWLLSAYEKHPDLKASTAPRESRRSETVAERTEKALTVESLRESITTGVIGPVVARMIEHGSVILHHSAKSLPKGMGKGVRGIQALTAPDGKVHLVASALSADTARGVMLHEAFHQGAEKLIGSAEWGKLMGRMGSLYRQSEQSTGRAREFFDKARDRVASAKRQGAVSTRMEVEEFAAYAIEEYERAPDSLPAAVRKWVEDMIGLVKAWLVKSYGKQLGQITPAQLSAFAKLAIMDVAASQRGEMFGPIGELFSVADPVNSPSFKRWFGGSKVVDAQGKPLVVYHGTDNDFSEFDSKENDLRWDGKDIQFKTFYFSSAEETAGSYGSKTMPVYLMMKNPKTINARGATWDNFNPFGKTVQAFADGHDGIIIKRIRDDHSGSGEESTVYVAFSPGQIKSATANNGDFDLNNPDIRYSVAPDAAERVAPATPAPGKTDPIVNEAEIEGLTPPDQGLLRRLQSTLQDNMNRLKQVQDRIGKIAGRESLGAADYYGAETNRPGRIAARLEDAKTQLTGPLMERLAKSGHTQTELEELLHAMHAEERNKRVAEINDDMPDGGSGMTTVLAGVVLAKYRGNRELHALAEQARDIAKATLDMKHAYGLIDDESHETLTKAYEYYIPLKGDGEFGPKVKRAMGHEERDEHILENIARDYDQAVMVGEKNLARQSLLRMVLEFRDDALWTARVPPKGRYIAGQVFNIVHNGETVGSFTSKAQVSAFLEAKGPQAGSYDVLTSNGEKVKEFTKPLQDNEIMVYVKGEPIRIQIKDEKLAAQLRPLDQGKMHPVLEFMRGVNRYLSKIYTGYNPAFILRNTARDAMTGTINMLGNEGAGVAAKAWMKYPGALKALGSWAATGKTPDTKTGGYLTEYRMHGGKVGASWMSDLEEQGKTLASMYEDAYGATGYLKDGKNLKAAKVAGRKIIGGMAHVVEIANQATENALRLSLFIALREQGESPGKAAQAAKSVTVDFDRKGTATGALGAIYLFFNPAVQGAANAIKTLVKGKHKEQAWAALGGLALLGVWAASKGMGDDKDRWLGEGWDTRTRNLMINVGGHQIRVPLSQEFAPVYALGVAMAEAGHGEDKMRSAVRVVSSFIDAYFPLQGAYSPDSDNHQLDLAMATVPTIIKPSMQAAVNRNNFGSQVVPESETTKDRPDNLKMFRGTKNSPYDAAAQQIASVGEMLGAGKYENDLTKISPESLKLLWRTYTGGLGQFVADTIGVAGMTASEPGQVEAGDIPIAKDFFRTNDVKPIRGRYYDLSKDAKQAITEFEQAKKAGDGEALDVIFSKPEKAELIGLGRMIRNTNKAAAAIRDEEVDINADKTLKPSEKRARLKAMEKDEEALYRSAIEALRK